MKPKITPKTLIACRIFYDELQAVLPATPDLRVVWIEAALHADLSRLEGALQTALTETAAAGGEVWLFLGAGCHPDIAKLAGEYGARLAPVRNCIEAFLGPRQKELEINGTMIMTPGWIRAWPDIMASLGWDAVDVRQNFGRYNRIPPGLEGFIQPDEEGGEWSYLEAGEPGEAPPGLSASPVPEVEQKAGLPGMSNPHLPLGQEPMVEGEKPDGKSVWPLLTTMAACICLGYAANMGHMIDGLVKSQTAIFNSNGSK